MPGNIPWTVERFSDAFVAAHTRWENDCAQGKPANRLFTVNFLRRSGLGRPVFLFRSDGRFSALLAAAPEAVRADWKESVVWDAASIIAALGALYAAWETDAVWGKPAGRRWSPVYLCRTPFGRRLAKAIYSSRLRPEMFLNRIGGAALADWRRYAVSWDPDTARAEFRKAHNEWRSDTTWGCLAGRPFNYTYLERTGRRLLYRRILGHWRGGIHAFARTISGVSLDWNVRRPYRRKEIRALALEFFRSWQSDPRGCPEARPFGRRYFARHGRRHVLEYVLRHGIQRTLRGSRFAPLRRVLNRRLSRAEYVRLAQGG